MLKFINEQSQNKILELVDSSFIDEKICVELFRAKKKKQVIEILRKYFSQTEEDRDMFWTNIIHKQWKEVDDIFRPTEIIFLRALNLSQGVMSKTDIINNLMSIPSCCKAAQSLIGAGYIDVIKIKTHEVIYFIRPEMYEFLGGKENGK